MDKDDLYLMSDEVLLERLGQRVARHRLNRNATQEDVAYEAGVSRDTLSRLENGRPIDTANLTRILRALGLLEALEALVPEPRVSPVALARERGQVRQRARGKRPSERSRREEWVWPDQR